MGKYNVNDSNYNYQTNGSKDRDNCKDGHDIDSNVTNCDNDDNNDDDDNDDNNDNDDADDKDGIDVIDWKSILVISATIRLFINILPDDVMTKSLSFID